VDRRISAFALLSTRSSLEFASSPSRFCQFIAYGEATSLSDLSDLNAIAASGDGDPAGSTIVLKLDGPVREWEEYTISKRSPSYGKASPGLTNVIAVAAGAEHRLALKADGAVVAWGSTFYKQTSVPTDLSNVVSISAARIFHLILKRRRYIDVLGLCERGFDHSSWNL
jgi:hypothetical protein